MSSCFGHTKSQATAIASDACCASVTGRARAELPGQGLPLAAGAESVHDPSEHLSVGSRRTAAQGVLAATRNDRGDLLPQGIRNVPELSFHANGRSSSALEGQRQDRCSAASADDSATPRCPI